MESLRRLINDCFLFLFVVICLFGISLLSETVFELKAFLGCKMWSPTSEKSENFRPCLSVSCSLFTYYCSLFDDVSFWFAFRFWYCLAARLVVNITSKFLIFISLYAYWPKMFFSVSLFFYIISLCDKMCSCLPLCHCFFVLKAVNAVLFSATVFPSICLCRLSFCLSLQAALTTMNIQQQHQHSVW